MQETLPDQLDAVLAALGSRYRSIGFGRSAGRSGESCPLIWDDSRLSLLDWRQEALSDEPDKPGSGSWGNLIPRIVVDATFRDVATGREMRAVNTHLDPLSRRSRVRSVSAIRQSVTGSTLPTIVLGDFNTTAGSATHRTLTGHSCSASSPPF